MSSTDNSVLAFKLPMASFSRAKDYDGNSDLNYHILTTKIPMKLLAHYRGNVSENTNYALLEGKMTFEKKN